MLIVQNNLSPVKQQKLRKLLDDDALDVLIEVIESKAFVHEGDAANQALRGTIGYDNEAKASAAKANTAHDAIALLKELRDTKIFTISSATPNTRKPNTK